MREIKNEPFLKRGDQVEFELTTVDEADTYKFEIKLEDDFRLLKLPAGDSVLSKGKINYWITKNGGNKGELQHKQDSLKKMYDSCYSSSNKIKNADFWEEIVICENGNKLKEERKM